MLVAAATGEDDLQVLASRGVVKRMDEKNPTRAEHVIQERIAVDLERIAKAMESVAVGASKVCEVMYEFVKKAATMPVMPDKNVSGEMLKTEFPIRAIKAVRREKIRRLGLQLEPAVARNYPIYIDDLLVMTSGELLGLKNFGECALHDVRKALEKKGLKLRGDP